MSTWRKLRSLFPAYRNETVDEYIRRVYNQLNEYQLDL